MKETKKARLDIKYGNLKQDLKDLIDIIKAEEIQGKDKT